MMYHQVHPRVAFHPGLSRVGLLRAKSCLPRQKIAVVCCFVRSSPQMELCVFFYCFFLWSGIFTFNQDLVRACLLHVAGSEMVLLISLAEVEARGSVCDTV